MKRGDLAIRFTGKTWNVIRMVADMFVVLYAFILIQGTYVLLLAVIVQELAGATDNAFNSVFFITIAVVAYLIALYSLVKQGAFAPIGLWRFLLPTIGLVVVIIA